MKASFNVGQRKKELLREYIAESPLAARGQVLVKRLTLALALLRTALVIFDVIYLEVQSVSPSVWSNLLALPLLLILYMIYDGNKGLVYIVMISAPARMIYLFTVTVPSFTAPEVNVYIVITILVLALQFFFAIFMSASNRCDMYFAARQKVNMKIRAEMMAGRK